MKTTNHEITNGTLTITTVETAEAELVYEAYTPGDGSIIHQVHKAGHQYYLVRLTRDVEGNYHNMMCTMGGCKPHNSPGATSHKTAEFLCQDMQQCCTPKAESGWAGHTIAKGQKSVHEHWPERIAP